MSDTLTGIGRTLAYPTPPVSITPMLGRNFQNIQRGDGAWWPRDRKKTKRLGLGGWRACVCGRAEKVKKTAEQQIRGPRREIGASETLLDTGRRETPPTRPRCRGLDTGLVGLGVDVDVDHARAIERYVLCLCCGSAIVPCMFKHRDAHTPNARRPSRQRVDSRSGAYVHVPVDLTRPHTVCGP